MDKYANLENAILAIFGTSGWNAEAIKTFPANFVAVGSGSEFIRVSIVPGGEGINLNSVSGVLIIDIFVSAGMGLKRSSVIADRLDSYLVGKSFTTSSGVLQLAGSGLAHKGVDKDDPSLHRSAYTVSFNFFGVS